MTKESLLVWSLAELEKRLSSFPVSIVGGRRVFYQRKYVVLHS